MKQIEFEGKIWVADGKTQWLEEFYALVTDQTVTKQGLVIKMKIGNYSANGDVFPLI